MTNALITQVDVDAFDTGAPAAKVTQVGVDALNTGAPAAKITEVAVDVLSTGKPGAKVSTVAIDVFRAIRDAPYPVFPVRLFNPPTLGVKLLGGAVFGPAAISGTRGVEDMPSSARWTFDFGQMPVLRPHQMKAWRSFVAAADNGVMPCIVSLWDRRHQPVTSHFTGSSSIGSRVWDDPVNIGFDQVNATFSAVAEEGATQVSFAFAGPKTLTGGEHFSVYGRKYNWRLYRVIRVLSDADGVVTAEIRPAMRDWARVGERLDFDYPCCVARIDGDMEASLDRLRLGQGQMRLIESDTRYP